MRAPIAENSHLEGGCGGFLEPWREYADSQRPVFLEQLLEFVRTVDRGELSAIRKAVWTRAKALRTFGKRGRPRGSRRRSPDAEQELGKSRADQQYSGGLAEGDGHDGFRDVCMVCMDFAHLRPIFLSQILCFVRGADKHDLAIIGKSVRERAKSRDLWKKRGRPRAQDDDRLSYRARKVVWLRHVEGKTWRQIAEALGMPIIEANKNTEGNIKTVSWTLQRLENYIAAKIWKAMYPSYVVRQGEQRGELKPGVLEHKPAQQWLWIKAGLPFRERPEECKKIVKALWPRGLRAATEQDQRYFAT